METFNLRSVSVGTVFRKRKKLVVRHDATLREQKGLTKSGRLEKKGDLGGGRS